MDGVPLEQQEELSGYLGGDLNKIQYCLDEVSFRTMSEHFSVLSHNLNSFLFVGIYPAPRGQILGKEKESGGKGYERSLHVDSRYSEL